jgi:PhnB protein
MPKKKIARKSTSRTAKKTVAKKVLKKKSPVKKTIVAKRSLTAKKSAKTKAKSVKKTVSKRVSYLPKGYNNITPYLVVKGAAKAIDFYKKVFGAKEALRMDMADGRIAHAELKIGDTKIMLTDECPEMNMLSPSAYGGVAVSIHLYAKNTDQIIKLAENAGAKTIKAAEDMYYGDRTGMIEDPFGHRWSISTHIEDVSKAMLKKRAAGLFGKKSM